MSNQRTVDLLGFLQDAPSSSTSPSYQPTTLHPAQNPPNTASDRNQQNHQGSTKPVSNPANPFNTVVSKNASNPRVISPAQPNGTRGSTQHTTSPHSGVSNSYVSTSSTVPSRSPNNLLIDPYNMSPTNANVASSPNNLTKINLDDDSVVTVSAQQKLDPLDILLGIHTPANGTSSTPPAVAHGPNNGVMGSEHFPQKNSTLAAQGTSSQSGFNNTPRSTQSGNNFSTDTFTNATSNFHAASSAITPKQAAQNSNAITFNQTTFTAFASPPQTNTTTVPHTNTAQFATNSLVKQPLVANSSERDSNASIVASSTTSSSQSHSPSVHSHSQQLSTGTPSPDAGNSSPQTDDQFFNDFFDGFTVQSSTPSNTSSLSQQQSKLPVAPVVPPRNHPTNTTNTHYQSNTRVPQSSTMALPHLPGQLKNQSQHSGCDPEALVPGGVASPSGTANLSHSHASQNSTHSSHEPSPCSPIREMNLAVNHSHPDSSTEEFFFVDFADEGKDLDDFLFSPVPRPRAIHTQPEPNKPTVPSRSKQPTPGQASKSSNEISASISPIGAPPTLPPRPSPAQATTELNVEFIDGEQYSLVLPGERDSNSTLRDNKMLPCLYTALPTKTPVSDTTVETLYIDIHQCHDETCSMANKLARHSADVCTCGGVDLPQASLQAKKAESSFAKDPNADHDFNIMLAPPHGAISSTQCSVEEKNNFLQNALFSCPPSQIHEPSYIKTFALTFNHYETIPTPQTVGLMLPANPLEFNIYAFTFQECGGVVKSQAMPFQVTNPVLTALNNACKGTLWSYKLVACEKVMSLFTFVIARVDLFPYIHQVKTNIVSTGILDIVGNKGAAIVRFFVKDTSFAIVGCHFNAGQSDVFKRNGDYHKINAKSNLGMADTTAYRNPALSKPVTEQIAHTLLECTHPHLVGESNPLLTPEAPSAPPPGFATPVGQPPSASFMALPSQSAPLTEQTKLFQGTLNSIRLKYKYNYVFAYPRLVYLAAERVRAGFKFRPSNTVEGKGVYTFTGSTKKEDVFATPEALYEYKSDLITRNDVVIWMGDLNYRIGGFGSRAKVFEELQQGKQTALVMRHDQLLQQKDIEGTIFHGFREGSISFPPSYKYDLNSQRFDTSAKSRIPGWTDRILYIDNCSQCFHQLYGACDCHGFAKGEGPKKGECALAKTVEISTLKKQRKTHHRPCQKVLLERYGSIQQIVTSDHRPVFAYFYINVAEKPASAQ